MKDDNIMRFWVDGEQGLQHFCTPEATNLVTYRDGVLGQYWVCRVCGSKTWEEIPCEDAKSH